MSTHPREDDASQESFLTSPAGLVMVGFLTIGGVYLWMEHRAYLLGFHTGLGKRSRPGKRCWISDSQGVSIR